MPEVPTAEALDTEFEWSASFKRERLERWLKNPFFRAWTGLVIFLRPPRELRALRWIQRVAPGGKMVDVGCGDGRLVAQAIRHGYDAYGVEVSPQMVHKSLRRLPRERIFCGRLQDWDQPEGSLDLVSTVSYMEHDPRPREAMQRIRALLRPGGICAHKTPNYDSWLRKLQGRRWSGFRWPEHVQYFSPVTLGRLMTECGFEVVRVSANSLGDNFWLAARRL